MNHEPDRIVWIPIEKIVVRKDIKNHSQQLSEDERRYLKDILSKINWTPATEKDIDWLVAEYIAQHEKLHPYNAILKGF